MKKMSKKKKLIMAIVALVLVAVIIVCIVIVASSSNKGYELLSAELTMGDLSVTADGSGYISFAGTVSHTIPSDLTILQYEKSVGDKIAVGDVIAYVDSQSLKSSISELSTSIASVDKSLGNISTTTQTKQITSSVAGRVKEVYAKDGKDIGEVITENGSLAIISIDGLMSFEVEIEECNLKYGDEIDVVRANGLVVDGKVVSVVGNTYKITISDEDGDLGEEVYVASLNDGVEQIYTAILSVNSPVSILATSGVIDNVIVAKNQYVTNGTVLMSLSESTTNVDFDSLITKRNSLEAELSSAVAISGQNAIISTVDGYLTSLPKNGSYSTTNEGSMQITFSVDESNIVSVNYDTVAKVVVEAISTMPMDGVVTNISQSSTTESGSAKYDVTVEFAIIDGMYTGMSAEVSLYLSGKDDINLLPTLAIYEDQQGQFVYTSKSGSELGGKIYVQTGISSQSQVEIVSGLENGQKVYYKIQTSTDDIKIDSSTNEDIQIMRPGMMGDMSGDDMQAMKDQFMAEMGGTTGERPSGMTGSASGSTGGMGRG